MELPNQELDMPIPLNSTYVGPISQAIVPSFNKMVKYKECLKNHAASIGCNATDGCGEFMPSGEEDTLESLTCSACTCHRNFHRKEIEGHESFYYSNVMNPRFGPNYNVRAIMSHNMRSLMASESDEEKTPMVKKRFRTKFSEEQKEKMLSFAEKVGWKIQKQEESVVQKFCQEVGVKRRVLKVWIHNNKHILAKKNSDQYENQEELGNDCHV